jgi:hypothetical protein
MGHYGQPAGGWSGDVTKLSYEYHAVASCGMYAKPREARV